MFLRLLFVNDSVPAVRAERFKMLANACQVIALAIFGAGVIAPEFSASLPPSPLARFVGGLVSGFFELLAMRFVGYAVVRSDQREG